MTCLTAQIWQERNRVKGDSEETTRPHRAEPSLPRSALTSRACPAQASAQPLVTETQVTKASPSTHLYALKTNARQCSRLCIDNGEQSNPCFLMTLLSRRWSGIESDKLTLYQGISQLRENGTESKFKTSCYRAGAAL